MTKARALLYMTEAAEMCEDISRSVVTLAKIEVHPTGLRVHTQHSDMDLTRHVSWLELETCNVNPLKAHLEAMMDEVHRYGGR